MSQSNLMLVLCTFPTKDVAQSIGNTLLHEKLCACISIIPSIESSFYWNGSISTEQETLGIIKTTQEIYPSIEARIKELHPYEVPEIISIPALNTSPAYLAWALQSMGIPS